MLAINTPVTRPPAFLYNVTIAFTIAFSTSLANNAHLLPIRVGRPDVNLELRHRIIMATPALLLNRPNSDPSTTKAELLGIPMEIRQQILALVILVPSTAPALPPTDDNRTTCQREESNIHYLIHPPVSTSFSLLLACQQINREVNQVLTGLKVTNKLRYELDCVLFKEESIYPTWTLLPNFANHVDIIETNFRIGGEHDGGRSGWRPMAGGPGYMVWSLLALMTRYLGHGPHFVGGSKQTQRSIGTLVRTLVAFLCSRFPSQVLG